MADFSRYTNWTPETSFNEVVFGKDSPLLEVEMNEMQEIEKANFSKIAKSVGDGFYPTDSSNYISYTTITAGSVYSVTLGEGDAVSSTGLFVHTKNNVAIRLENFTSGSRYIYLKMWEDNATFETVLKEYGNDDGGQIVNPIKDNRYDNETSRRKLTKYKVESGLLVPSNTSEFAYVGIGFYTKNNDNTLTWNKLSTLYDSAINAAQQSLINRGNIEGLRDIGKLYVGLLSRFNKYDYEFGGVGAKGVSMSPTNTPMGEVNSMTVYGSTNFTSTNFKPPYLYTISGTFLLQVYDLSTGSQTHLPPVGTPYSFEYRITASLGRIYNGGYSITSSDSALSVGDFNGCKIVYRSEGDVTNIEIPFSFSFPAGMYEYTSNTHFGVSISILEIYSYNSTTGNWVKCTNKMKQTVDDAYTLVPFTNLDLENTGSDSSKPRLIQLKGEVTSGAQDFDAIIKDYNALMNKPSINSVTLTGNKTSSDLHIEGGTGEESTAQEVEDMIDDIFGTEET